MKCHALIFHGMIHAYKHAENSLMCTYLTWHGVTVCGSIGNHAAWYTPNNFRKSFAFPLFMRISHQFKIRNQAFFIALKHAPGFAM
jgi:hypothetical protein